MADRMQEDEATKFGYEIKMWGSVFLHSSVRISHRGGLETKDNTSLFFIPAYFL
jgi:hypothetical protein